MHVRGIAGYRVASLGLRHAASTALIFMHMTLAEVSEASCPWLNRRAGAGALGVELAGKVFQAAVDLHGDHSVAGPSRPAISSAAARFAPVEGPEKMPSSPAALRAVANARASGTSMTSS